MIDFVAATPTERFKDVDGDKQRVALSVFRSFLTAANLQVLYFSSRPLFFLQLVPASMMTVTTTAWPVPLQFVQVVFSTFCYVDGHSLFRSRLLDFCSEDSENQHCFFLLLLNLKLLFLA